MQKTSRIWLDGKMVPWEQAQVHVLTHTLHYGWGAFEGIRCYECSGGRSAVFRLKEHVDRLFASCLILGIKMPFNRTQIGEACLHVLRENKLKEGYIRPLVFIGDGEMGLLVKNPPVRVMVACWPWGTYLGEDGVKNGIRAKISSFARHHINSNMTKAKAPGYYVNSILAKKEVTDAGYDEAILLDTEGFVSECSGENVFMVKSGLIKTPPPATVLGGITRDTIIEFATDQSIKVVEHPFTRDELYCADEVFITGTAAEITPVREIDGRKIGTGRPGKKTKALQEQFFQVVRGENSDYLRWLTFV